MGTEERREREREQVRQRILDVARTLFVAEGVEAVTMRRIAEGLEYTAGALYRHFPDKASLLQQLVRDDYQAFTRSLHRIAGLRDPVERLSAMGEAYVAFGVAHPEHYRLLFLTPLPGAAHAAAEEAPAPGVGDAFTFLLETVADCIAAGRLRPELKDPHLVARAAWACVHGVVALHIVAAPPPGAPALAPAKVAQVLLTAFIRGLVRAGKPNPQSRRKS